MLLIVMLLADPASAFVKLSPDALTTCKLPPYAKYDDAVNQCS